jgi:hypothetical protein
MRLCPRATPIALSLPRQASHHASMHIGSKAIVFLPAAVVPKQGVLTK